jgi:Fe-S-cluster containining protein
MDFNLTPYFQQYEKLVKQADAAFDRVRQEYPQCVSCGLECSDCCFALFDLTLIEAMYIKTKFQQEFSEDQRAAIVEAANVADRKIHQLKKKAYKEFEGGKEQDQILAEMAEQRVQCPLLDENHHCRLYDFRPITCRLYGVPTSIGGKGHTCGKSAFLEGESYPTVNIDIINRGLYKISHDFSQTIRSKYAKLGEMLVPLSMALLTDYTEEYLGVRQADEPKEDI